MTGLAVPIIQIDGRYLFKDNERFIARGVVYRPRKTDKTVLDGAWAMADPLDQSNYMRLLQDVQAFKELHINALWIYDHDPDASHDDCMDLLALNGIYVIFSLSSPVIALDRVQPQRSYSPGLLSRYSKIIDSVARYRNTLGVSVADQVVNQDSVYKFNNMTAVWDVIGHTIRDLKQYMRFKNVDTGQRMIPLCVNDGQWASLNSPTFEYLFHSGPTLDTVRPAGGRPDFYCFIHYLRDQDPYHGLNITASVSETEERAMRDGAFNQLAAMDVNIPGVPGIKYRGEWARQIPMDKFAKVLDPVPVIVSEYGTTVTRPRQFDEVKELYGRDMGSLMLHYLSGGFAYEFFEDLNRYGLVQVDYDGNLKKLNDFIHFRDRMNYVMGYSAGDNSDADPHVSSAESSEF